MLFVKGKTVWYIVAKHAAGVFSYMREKEKVWSLMLAGNPASNIKGQFTTKF